MQFILHLGGNKNDKSNSLIDNLRPSDTGDEIDGPDALGSMALEHGVLSGRNGLGSIFVFASGNGGMKDNCNFDGYANSIYTVTIGSGKNVVVYC